MLQARFCTSKKSQHIILGIKWYHIYILFFSVFYELLMFGLKLVIGELEEKEA
jgi:hypothetical protein